jgi:hypothetical protein
VVIPAEIRERYSRAEMVERQWRRKVISAFSQ